MLPTPLLRALSWFQGVGSVFRGRFVDCSRKATCTGCFALRHLLLDVGGSPSLRRTARVYPGLRFLRNATKSYMRTPTRCDMKTASFSLLPLDFRSLPDTPPPPFFSGQTEIMVLSDGPTPPTLPPSPTPPPATVPPTTAEPVTPTGDLTPVGLLPLAQSSTGTTRRPGMTRETFPLKVGSCVTPLVDRLAPTATAAFSRRILLLSGWCHIFFAGR